MGASLSNMRASARCEQEAGLSPHPAHPRLLRAVMALTDLFLEFGEEGIQWHGAGGTDLEEQGVFYYVCTFCIVERFAGSLCNVTPRYGGPMGKM